VELREKILGGDRKVGVIGQGFIGFSTAAYFAHAGCKVVGYDINEEIVKHIKYHAIPVTGLEKWLPFHIAWDNIKSTTNFEDLKDCNPIFIAVPTEKGAEPWFEPLQDVIERLEQFKEKKLIIIESTLAPGTIEKIVLPKTKHDIVCASRRDWFFEDNSKNLKNLPRIVGGTTMESTEQAIDVLSIICDHLLPCHFKEAELIKATENTLRAVDICVANQLMLAYPHIDIRKVLKLAGTKWNVEVYIPSWGVGGYCIPVAPKYLVMGSENPDMLSILKTALEDSIEYHTVWILMNILEKFKPTSIAILGATYAGNLKVSVLSPTFKIVNYLDEVGIRYAVHDPLYTCEEMTDFNFPVVDYPDGLNDFDMVLIVADHDLYKHTRPDFKGIVVDQTGVWQKWKKQFSHYHLLGESL